MGIRHNNRLRVGLRSCQKEVQMAIIGASGRSHYASRGCADEMCQAILDLSHLRSGFYDLFPHRR